MGVMGVMGVMRTGAGIEQGLYLDLGEEHARLWGEVCGEIIALGE